MTTDGVLMAGAFFITIILLLPTEPEHKEEDDPYDF